MTRPVYEDDKRFQFGENWKRFLSVLDQERIIEAENSLREMLGIHSLEGKSFLDIGSGSGLFSLAARRLGAKVFSFDFDNDSVACTVELKRRYFPEDEDWIINQGSVLDLDYIRNLGTFDVVYSWGVLHHTGAMWIGIENAISRVAKDGLLYIAIYNDQGWKSHIWWFIKLFYNKLPKPLNTIYAYSLDFLVRLIALLKYTIKLQPMVIIGSWFNYKKKRGMSLSHDIIDWIGGFPFEFSTYEVLSDYMKARSFELKNGRKNSSLGCHTMVFMKTNAL